MKKVLVALLSLGVALAAAFAVLSRSEREVLAWVKLRLPHPFERGTFDGQTAHALFGPALDSDFFRWDPETYLQPAASQEVYWEWPEHPRGGFLLRTNPRGFWEDDPVGEKRGTRVLVLGDSHAQGVCDNADSFANVLEALLRTDEPGADVVNASVAYTGPACYLARLRSCLDLAPDVVVATLYTGNDFVDDLRLRYHLDGWWPPKGPAGYRERVAGAMERWRGATSQGLNQAARFAAFPGEAERALGLVVDSFAEMHAVCHERGVRFVALVLPTKLDVDPGAADTVEAAAAHLGLDGPALAVQRALGVRFLRAMTERGIVCADPMEAMVSHPTPLYWERDHHLALEGHRLVAGELLGAIRGLGHPASAPAGTIATR